MRCSIHQPNFMPWLPYFDKIAASDVFVILTECQFEKGGFQNRFNVGSDWFTMSVPNKIETISNKIYTKPQEDWERIKRRLSPFRSRLSEYDHLISPSLAATNIGIIERILDELEISVEIQRDFVTEVSGTERLVEICKSVDASVYLSGPSGKNYMNLDLFAQAGIRVEFFDSPSDRKKPILSHLHG